MKRWFIVFCMVLIPYTSKTISFDEVLLIINFNHKHYENISFLKYLYEDYFNNIVFFGPEEHEEVIVNKHIGGYLSYDVIAQAMLMFPEYRGYLFLMDDCIMHPWLMKDMPSDKIWFSRIGKIWFADNNPELLAHQRDNDFEGAIMSLDKPKTFCGWYLWQTEYGYDTVCKTYKLLHEKWIDKLKEQLGYRNVLGTFSDIGYIPCEYCEDFIELSCCFHRNNVFLEIALPSILCCLAPLGEWNFMYGIDTKRHAVRSIDNYPHDAIFIHPIKLSSAMNRSIVKTIFDEHKKLEICDEV